MRFKAGGAAKKAAIAIEAAKRPNRQFGEEALEKSSRLGPTSSFALARRATKQHGKPLGNGRLRGKQRAVPARALRSLEVSRLSALLAH
jgi:hypothetical protein